MKTAFISPLALTAGLLLAGAPVAGQEPPAEETEAESPTATEDAKDWLEELRRLYDLAREKGGEVPADLWTWAREDFEGFGDWEYRVLTLAASDDAAIEEQLGLLGRERWDCFWVEPVDEGVRFYFKRPRRTYMDKVPISNLLKALSGTEATEP